MFSFFLLIIANVYCYRSSSCYKDNMIIIAGSIYPSSHSFCFFHFLHTGYECTEIRKKKKENLK